MKFRNCFLITVLLIFAVSAASAAAQSVSILTTQWEDHIFAENGTDELVKCYSQNAVVLISENPEAEEKINTALREVEDQLMNDCRSSVREQHEITADILKETGSEGEAWKPMFTMEMRRELTPQRTSEGVVSFETVDYIYTGGAHGMYGVYGLNFDTLTGEELTLEALSRDPEAFRAACVAEMVRQGLLMENLWFITEDELLPKMETIADRDSWYLTDTGIVFHAAPYELAPYSEGALEFLVPYSELPGLKY